MLLLSENASAFSTWPVIIDTECHNGVLTSRSELLASSDSVRSSMGATAFLLGLADLRVSLARGFFHFPDSRTRSTSKVVFLFGVAREQLGHIVPAHGSIGAASTHHPASVSPAGIAVRDPAMPM